MAANLLRELVHLSYLCEDRDNFYESYAAHETLRYDLDLRTRPLALGQRQAAELEG